MQLAHIYCLENRITGRLYVGQTIHPQKRISSHARAAEDLVISHAVRKHGWNNFTVHWIETVPYPDVESAERYWIQYFGSVAPHGYNVNEGGGLSPMLTSAVAAKVSATKKAQAARGECSTQQSEHRAKNSATTRAQAERGELWCQSEEGRAWSSAYQKELVAQGKHWNQQPEFRKTISEAQKALWRDPVYRERQIASFKKRPPMTPEVCIKMRKGHARRRRRLARDAGQLELMSGLYYHEEEDDGE